MREQLNETQINLEKIREHLEHANLKQKYNISSKKSVILYATEFLQEMHSTQGRYNYNSLVFKKLLDQFSNDEKYEIIESHGSFVFSGDLIEKLFSLNGSNDSVLEEIFYRFETSNLSKEVESFGITDGDTIVLGNLEFEYKK